MKLLKDLGMQFPTEVSKNKTRFGLYECPLCFSQTKVMVKSIKARGLTACHDCRSVKHGLTTHPIYTLWGNIKTRCYNTESDDFPFYGAKGVTFDAEWNDNFLSFYKWCIENGWSKGLHCDKDILCDKLGIFPQTYSPLTISFIPASQNAMVKGQNQRFKGVRPTKTGFRSVITYNKTRKYLGTFKTKVEAAKAYNSFITANNLPHIKNIVD